MINNLSDKAHHGQRRHQELHPQTSGQKGARGLESMSKKPEQSTPDKNLSKTCRAWQTVDRVGMTSPVRRRVATWSTELCLAAVCIQICYCCMPLQQTVDQQPCKGGLSNLLAAYHSNNWSGCEFGERCFCNDHCCLPPFGAEIHGLRHRRVLENDRLVLQFKRAFRRCRLLVRLFRGRHVTECENLIGVPRQSGWLK